MQMRRKLTEIVVGLFILAGVAALLILAIQVSGAHSYMKDYYEITAKFDNIGGLKPGAAVTMAGVRVGEVNSISLDKETYRAAVILRINHDTKLPTDTSASIYTEGLLGANYIALTPGFDVDNSLQKGEELATTHSALILENLIGQLVFSLQNDKKENKENKDNKKEITEAKMGTDKAAS
jgi:phospholipid/cholesterol/gamma-HCH transport system substrate-binding protein